MNNKKKNYVIFMLEVLSFEIIALLIGFMFLIQPNAEIISQRPNLSSDNGGDYVNQVIDGIRWHLIGGSPNITTLYAYYDYRMANLERRYTLSFWVYSQGSTPYVTINGQPCNTLPNNYQIQNSGNYNAYEQVQGYTWLINCPNIAPNPNQFYVRIGNLRSNLSPSLQGIGANFYVDSFPSESSAINGAVGQIQEALIQNNNTNTSNIISSVNNMTNTLNQQQQQTNQKLDDINNTLNDSSVDGFSVNYDNDTNVISGLITMPITLSRAYLNGLNSSCRPYNLGSLYGSNLVLPCVNISSWLGSSLFSIIDVLISGFLIYAIAKMFIRTFNKLTNLNNREVEGDLFND